MSETLQKREFRERDVNRMRNIIQKKFGDKTVQQIGYTKASDEHKEGDIWEENSKMWTIKDGIKQSYTKLDSIKKSIAMPLVCPNCGKPMKIALDKKMYPIHKKCFDCVIKAETKLRLEGKYDEYVNNIINKNMITYIEEAQDFFESLMAHKSPTYVTEQGDIEEVTGNIDKEKIKELWTKELEDLKQTLKNT